MGGANLNAAVSDAAAALTRHHRITAGESQVLALVRLGMPDEVISKALGIDPRAVESRLRRFRGRSGLAGRAVVVWAVEHRGCCVNKSLREAT
jgi:DNA-binding CsgD family transcriptional regulator